MRLDQELLIGAIDIHVHVAPDLYPRILDAVDLARAGREAGFRALGIKTHNFPTCHMALLAEKMVPGIDMMSSIVCNLQVGGVNPMAVEAAIKYGARQVYLPTIDSTNHQVITGQVGQHGKGLTIAGGLSRYTLEHPRIDLLEDGALSEATREVIQLVADADIILNCGHISVREMRAVIAAAQDQRVRRIVVDHPFWSKIPPAEQVGLAEAGAIVNFVAGEVLPRWHAASLSEYAAAIRAVGVERAVLSSDCGQLHNPLPAEAMRLLCQLLLEEEFTPAEIRRMLHQTPADLVYP
jgi:Family of unknown function (DUF6282)